MRVQVLLNLGAGWPPFTEDQIVDVTDDLGQRLVAANLAKPVDEPKPGSKPQPEENFSKPNRRRGRQE
jgi:hypothetical protein